MKYIMLIYQGSALETQAALPEAEQKQIYADYGAINTTPGVTPGLPMGLPEHATTVRVERERRVTTGEDKLQPLVGKRRGGHGLLGNGGGEQARLGGERPLAANAIRGTVPRRGHQPRARIGRDAVARPSFGGDGERLLRGFLGAVEVAEKADQGGQDAAPFLAEDPIECRYQ